MVLKYADIVLKYADAVFKMVPLFYKMVHWSFKMVLYKNYAFPSLSISVTVFILWWVLLYKIVP